MIRDRQGFTLVEVLLSAAILGIGLMVLMTGLSQCLRAVGSASRYMAAQRVLGLGELVYPFRVSEDVERDLAVSPDATLVDGYVFEREAEPESETDTEGLFVVRTRVSWGRGGSGDVEELVRYVWQRREMEGRP